MPNARRLSASGQSLHARCAQAIANFDSQDDPADIEDAVMAFLPTDEPLRSEAIDTLAKVRAERFVRIFLRIFLRARPLTASILYLRVRR